MCNPRRVIVKIDQAIREEWSRTVEAHVAEQIDIAAEATIETSLDLANELGPVAIEELHALLAEGYGGWVAEGDGFALALDHGISLHYTPETRALRVSAHLHETVEAAADAHATAQGIVEGQLEVEGFGRYYEDGWGGRTESYARHIAERDAQEKLEQSLALLRAEQQQTALDEAQQHAESQARALAQARVREEAERRRALLQEQLETLLYESEEHVQAAIGRLLGQTYRRTLIRLVHENGGTIVQDEEQGTTIELVARL